jgi:uncharacterized RDD family membrane protein YckC
MSHYGTPPPDGSEDQPEGTQTPPGSHAAEPASYNPYPDDWDAPTRGVEPFVAGAAGDQPAGSDPYGSSPYGAQPTGPAGGNPYAGSPRADRPTFAFGGYAGWFTRVGAYLIDYVLSLVAGFPLLIGYALLISDRTTTVDANGVKHLHLHQTGTTAALIGLGALMSLAFQIWNIYIRQGRTGASIGKNLLAIRLVNADLQPIGPGWCFLRNLLHILDALPCYLGFLWPIWDSRKQTFADKIMSSYVIQATTPQPRVF